MQTCRTRVKVRGPCHTTVPLLTSSLYGRQKLLAVIARRGGKQESPDDCSPYLGAVRT